MAERNATEAKLRDPKEPEFGHDGAKADADERPKPGNERKPGLTPGKNADSHVQMEKTDQRSKST